MATQETRGPEDGGEPSSTGNFANLHFFRPNDGIYVSEGPEQRTICVSPHLPVVMARTGDWHVEQFELHKELYRGKTSLLYMATDRVSGTQVALKLYRKRKLSVLNRYQVEREVRLHINLHHENIIQLFAAFEDEKHVYMVQEFAVCGDLFEDLKKGGGQLKEKYAVRDVVVPFLSALSYLHNQGIIHRDIKPENILLGANKAIKVADFGLSININHERPVTRAGTLDYMAPEVLVCPDKRRPEENKDKVLLGYSAQVDSWAVGILAYELLVGYPPFEQESRAATYEHIMYKEPKYPSWMTEEAKKFIGLALCKNATQRPTIVDLMHHSWVQPYMMRHLMPAPSSSTAPGPSRLRNSVSHTSGETREAAQSSSTSGMAAPPSLPTSTTGMIPVPGFGGAGSSGRLFLPAPAVPPPAVQHPADSSSSSSKYPPHAAAASSTAAVHRPVQPPSNMGLKTSASMQPQRAQGSHDPVISGLGVDDGGRMHDSISDPTTRAFELANPHPPGAASAASLYANGAVSRSAGGVETERFGSYALASAASLSAGGSVRALQVLAAMPSQGGMPAGQGGPAPPRHRMAALIPPINISAAIAAQMRMPAPPISPKPHNPEVAAGYHRPASGVLSDDSFLPPARSPSISLGAQLLSPLQAQLLGPRPSSRLNSPSHSRRNSLSQAAQPAATSAQLVLHSSTPLPQLNGDYGDVGSDDPALRTSSSHHRGGGTPGSNGGAGGGGKIFSKLWTRDQAANGLCSAESAVDAHSGASFTSRVGVGGGIPSTGLSASPVARSTAAARVRMMTPEDMRPLMRESSMSSSFKSNLRDDLMQQSMTSYHRPGKVHGVGRAAVAAREAEAAEAGLGHGAGNVTKTKSLVNRNLNSALADDGAPLARFGSDAALVRTAAGASAAAASNPAVASQRSFTTANSAFARKLANGAIATKVAEYVKGRLPHDEDMAD